MTPDEHAQLHAMASGWREMESEHDRSELLAWLEKHSPVPSIRLTDVQQLMVRLSAAARETSGGPQAGALFWAAAQVQELIDQHAPQPPNPYPQGTYLWAREEHKRKHAVGRVDRSRAIEPHRDWGEELFFDADITATDWEIV